ncbi:hypothetical protein O6H91_12G054500 [Diphasiastrum complanatum]|uniref:Uncharacterized protein n=1 Tax=Diphasiastrum complanatum TaxID=34168 RepID=A0ACC2C2D0_DIPCM|nr:hypothetical protein O6H91_12G054500 [Diphasiastrum complanatum]
MNQYHIYEAIGRGKHSQTVYKGRKKKSIDYYAIKSVEKSQKNKVLQEVRTLHSLDNPNVLKFFAWYETSAHLWLVLEYCVGGDLLTLLKQDTRLPEESVHDFARDLVHALQFLHSKGVVYCDLKPSNILLDENGRLKLCDFGLARRLSDISKSSVQQLPQAKRGTPCYMAPELFEEGGVHSFSSDLWALGCVMYECYTGRPPFVSTSFTELVNMILHNPVPPLLGNASKDFKDLVSQLLIKDPAERLQWSELRDHPYWRMKIKGLLLPAQPAYANFLKHSIKSYMSDSVLLEMPNGPQNQKYAQLDHTYTQVEQPAKGRSEIIAKNITSSSENTAVMENIARKMKVQTTSGPLSVNGSVSSKVAVNILRLSKVVKTNLQRDAESEFYRQPAASCTYENDPDVKMESNDQELDFAESREVETNQDKDEEAGDAPADNKLNAFGEAKGLDSFRETPAQTNANEIQDDVFEHVSSAESNGNGFAKHTEEGPFHPIAAATPPKSVAVPRKGQHIVPLCTEKKHMAPPISNVNKDPGKAASISLSEAFWHQSDLAVRPIVNRRVEKVHETIFDTRVLHVDALSASEFVGLASEKLEMFISRLASGLQGSTPHNEKLNTLKYVESLCTDMDSANLLINGPLITPMLIKMLRTTKTADLRMQLIIVIGLLIRHATLIAEELATSGIVTVLTEALRDKQEKVRRCAMAALGELLFYIATQSEDCHKAGSHEVPQVKDGRISSAWQIPSTCFALVGSILRKGEDNVTQHYALKTIENVSSQGMEWAGRFTSHEILGNLCYIYKTSAKQENLKIMAGSCLVRLLRFGFSSIPIVFEKLPVKELVADLCRGNSKLHAININLIYIALAGSSVMHNNISKYLVPAFEDKAVVPSIIGMLEQGPEVLRGKALICVALLCKISCRWLHSFCHAKLLSVLERLGKDKDIFVQQCVVAFNQAIVGLVPEILENVSSDFQQQASVKRPSPVIVHGSFFGRSQNRTSVPLLSILLVLLKSPSFREQIVDEQSLNQIAGFLQRLEVAGFEVQDDFQSNLLRILEVLSQQTSTLLRHLNKFIFPILPSLAVLYKKIKDCDLRCLCLKIFCDIFFVTFENMTDANLEAPFEVANGSKIEGTRSRKAHIECIVKQYLLPLYPVLVDDEDPIPIYAQRLLLMLLDVECIKVEDILKLKLASRFFEFLQEDFSCISLHNVQLCLFLVSSSDVDTKVLADLQVIGRFMDLLEFVYVKGMQDYIEPVLSTCRFFLIRNSNNCADSGQTLLVDDFECGKQTRVFLELCNGDGQTIAHIAAECLLMLLKVAPNAATEHFIRNLQLLTKLLDKSVNVQHANTTVIRLQKHLLDALCLGCKQYRVANVKVLITFVPSLSDIIALQNVVLKLKKSSFTQVAEASIDAALELQLLAGLTCS